VEARADGKGARSRQADPASRQEGRPGQRAAQAVPALPRQGRAGRLQGRGEAILLQDVEALGPKGTVIDVSKGYLRNYLVPRKLAQPASRAAIEAVRQRQEAAERAERHAIERAEENVKLLNRTVLTIPQQAGADGRLFGSVTAQDIAAAIREARGLRIDKRDVHLPEPIKNVGTYMVVVQVVENLTATIKTMVVAKK
jgi:large subunit ribosomal protein L9